MNSHIFHLPLKEYFRARENLPGRREALDLLGVGNPEDNALIRLMWERDYYRHHARELLETCKFAASELRDFNSESEAALEIDSVICGLNLD